MVKHTVVHLREPIEIPDDGIVSRTIYSDDDQRVVLFSFARGQQLTDHSAPFPVTLVIIDGEADITVEGQAVEGQAGTWLHMPADALHSVTARTPVTLLLTLLKQRH